MKNSPCKYDRNQCWFYSDAQRSETGWEIKKHIVRKQHGRILHEQ